ncbi:IPT/TIG domain-containing protein, partial [Thermogemmatispora sp.]|uniref:IPT/TIG domain-containing protein n=1 Tax=Thermogemmatispora sp. TaxID=1968838 RepID=UPI002ACC1E54
MAYPRETVVALRATSQQLCEQRPARRRRRRLRYLRSGLKIGLASFLLGLLTAWLLVAISSHNIAQAASRESGTLSISPSSGPAGTVITVSGSGWTQLSDGSQVLLGYSQQDCLLGYTPANNSQPGTVQSGSFSGWLVLPGNLAAGTYKICALIGATPTSAGSYTLLSSASPALSISPAKVTAGQTATIIGSNFLPGGTLITLVLQAGNTSINLGNVTSDSQGNFTRTIVIPTGLVGPAQIKASVGSGSPPTLSASVSFTINPAPALAPTASSATAAVTTPSPTPTHAPP